MGNQYLVVSTTFDAVRNLGHQAKNVNKRNNTTPRADCQAGGKKKPARIQRTDAGRGLKRKGRRIGQSRLRGSTGMNLPRQTDWPAYTAICVMFAIWMITRSPACG